MPVISVAERGRAADGAFLARVGFGDGGEYDVTVTDPFDAPQEERLAWYFEEHLRYPFLDREIAEQAVADLDAGGRALFGQVFGGAALPEYRALAGRAFDGCRLQVQGSAAFHRLHWEALRDPDLPVPLAVRLPVTRRVDGRAGRFLVAEPGDTLNILVVTARPDGPGDVGYRTISRPLLDGLRQADRPVAVDIVRPGTWDALRAALGRHPSGHYHVVHFDVHGAVAPYEAMRGQARYLFGGTEPYEGERGYLFLETAEIGKALPVTATQVADLLAEHRVPVAVLNACQSAKESASEASEASLAQRLVEAGVPVAVGMAYSVTVTAAAQAMPIFYAELAQGRAPVEAGHAARRALYEPKARQAYFDQRIDLEDWVLPVVFAQRPLAIELREMTVDRQNAFWDREAELADEPRPVYGFVGRDPDIHAIERALLLDPQRGMVLVQGMAGAGKSTLLAHLRWWWQRTGLVERTCAFSWADRAWDTQQILRTIAAGLLDPVAQAALELRPVAAQIEQIAALLRARRHLLVLDNCESITASPAAIPHSLTSQARDELARFLSRLRGGRTLVVLGSRQAEDWLAGQSFDDNVYALPGLDDQAASVLTHRILARHGGTKHEADEKERVALRDLRTLLRGYPLPLEVVLPELRKRTPTEVLAALQDGMPDADPVGLISRAIEYSHGNLDPAAQRSLLLLAPFTGSIPGPALGKYAEYLAAEEAVVALGPFDLDAAVAEAVRVGLAEPHPDFTGWVAVLPVLPFFLRSRLAEHPGLAEALAQAHYRLYHDRLGPEINQLLTSIEPGERKAGNVAARVEYANLNVAIDHALGSEQPVLAVLAAVEELLDQSKNQDARRRLLDRVVEERDAATGEELRRELAHLLHLAGMVAEHQRRFGDAEAAYRKALELWVEFGDRHNAARTSQQLGNAAQLQRRFGDAEAAYRQALQLLLEFGDRHTAAGIYHNLGAVAQEQRRFGDAEAAYRQALELKLEFGDRHGAASTYHQLGNAAQLQRRFGDAEAAYRKALDLWLEFGDRYEAADTYHELGRMAQEQRRLGDAEAAYRQALDLWLEFGDRHGAASTYHQLGNTAQLQRRFGDAEAAYRKALELWFEFDDRHSAAPGYHNLGAVAHEQRRFGDAEAAYRKALELWLEFDDRYEAADTYVVLGIALREQGRAVEAVAEFAAAAAAWHHTTGDWLPNALDPLRELRAEFPPEDFHRAVAEHITAEEAADVLAALDET